MKREPLSKKIRFEIFKRDGFKCRYCGAGVGVDTVLEIDHITPVSKGGGNHPINLVTACYACNRGKSKHLLKDPAIVQHDYKEQAEMLIEQREQLDAYMQMQDHENKVRKDAARISIKPLLTVIKKRKADPGWLVSADTFISHLGFQDVYKAATIAADRYRQGIAKNPFLYFCGICRISMKTGIVVGEG